MLKNLIETLLTLDVFIIHLALKKSPSLGTGLVDFRYSQADIFSQNILLAIGLLKLL